MTELLRRSHLVTYADTDAAGVIYYAAWVPLIERVHTAWLLTHGFRDPEYRERWGVQSACRAVSVEYFAPVRLFDELELVLHVDHIGTTSYRVRLDYLVGDQRAGQGIMTVAFFDEKKAPIPEELRAVLHRALSSGPTP